MFDTIREQMSVFECTFSVEVDGKVKHDRIQAPRAILEQQFVSLMQQAADTEQLVKIKMSRTVPFYDSFDKEWINREYCVTFINNAYIKANGEKF